jgi:hypothetical protein
VFEVVKQRLAEDLVDRDLFGASHGFRTPSVLRIDAYGDEVYYLEGLHVRRPSFAH